MAKIDDAAFLQLAKSNAHLGASFAWFYIGQKAAWDGKLKEAEAAFKSAVKEADQSDVTGAQREATTEHFNEGEQTDVTDTVVNFAAVCRDLSFLQESVNKPALVANDVPVQVLYLKLPIQAKVVLESSEALPIAPATTDQNGRYTFPKVPPGKYTLKALSLEAIQESYRKAEVEITVPPPQPFFPITVDLK
jgi:hypothetical protein